MNQIVHRVFPWMEREWECHSFHLDEASGKIYLSSYKKEPFIPLGCGYFALGSFGNLLGVIMGAASLKRNFRPSLPVGCLIPGEVIISHDLGGFRLHGGFGHFIAF